MTDTIRIQATIDVSDGPHVALDNSLGVAEYAKATATIGKGSAVPTVDVAFPDGDLLCVYASVYDLKITYKLGTAEGPLTAPLILIGGAVIKLLAVDKLTVTNESDAPVDVSVLSARVPETT